MDLKALVKTGVVRDHLNLHDRKQQNQLYDSINKSKTQLLFDIFFENTKSLDLVADYYGEKQGFYFAWLIHYTSWLILPSVIGVVIYLI